MEVRDSIPAHEVDRPGRGDEIVRCIEQAGNRGWPGQLAGVHRAGLCVMSNARSTGGRSPFHVGLGILALVAIVTMTVAVPSWGVLRRPALVRASQVFTVSSVEPGRYLCSRRSNNEPGGSALIRQRFIEFERNDLVELELDEAVVTGAAIEVGQRLAVVRSLRNEHHLQQLRAERDALVARRSLLEAGGLPADVEAAKKRVAVARAEHQTAVAELERARALLGSGLISDYEFDVIESEALVCRLEVDSSLADVEVARDAARPEAVLSLDSEISAVEANITELLRLADQRVVLSPIAGVARIGTERNEIEVHSIDTVYLAIPIPESKRALAQPGNTVRYAGNDPGLGIFEGKIVAIANDNVVINGQPVAWVTAEIGNPSLTLMPGTAGTAEILSDRESPTLGATLSSLLRTGP